jgi:peptide/nickel transport system permease protein
MDQATTDGLERALELLQAEQCQEASALLARFLTRDPGNERGWHMLSYALTDREKQIYALRRVLQINPGNRAARSRLERLAAIGVPQAATLPQAKVVPAVPQPVQVMGSHVRAAEPNPALMPKRPAPASRGTPDSSGYLPSVWRSGPAAITITPERKIFPFPGREAMPAVKHSRWQWLRIRSGLAWQRFKMDWAVFAESRLAILGIVIIAMFGLMAIAHPILMRTIWPRSIYDPVTGFDMAVFSHPALPSPGHLLGTDTLGRDVLSMLLAATTPTFTIGLTAALATALVGTAMSVTAAYFRGPVDAIITNVADVFLLFPAPVIMIIIGARFRDLGPVPLGLIYGFVTGAGATALVMRSHALQIVSKPYMEAAQIGGGGSAHIITKHLLPAMLPLAALQMMIAVTGAVVADGFISFFGLTRTVSNWGTLIYDAFVYAQIGSAQGAMWHMLLPAALSFSLFATGFYLVSRGLHRVASPTIREEQAVA